MERIFSPQEYYDIHTESWLNGYIRELIKYLNIKSKKNIFLININDDDKESNINQLKINNSEKITVKPCIGIYPLEKKANIYFENLYELSEDEVTKKVKKSLVYLCDNNSFGVYIFDRKFIEDKNKGINKKLINVLTDNTFRIDAIFGGPFMDGLSDSLVPFVMVLIRKIGDGKFCPKNKALFLPFDKFEDYIHIQKHLDMGMLININPLKKEIKNTRSKEFKIFKKFTHYLEEYYGDDSEEFDEMMKKFQDIYEKNYDDADPFEYGLLEGNPLVFDTDDFTNIEQSYSYADAYTEFSLDVDNDNEYKAYLLSDVIEIKTIIDDEKQTKDKKNSIYLKKEFTADECDLLSKVDLLENLTGKNINYICLTTIDENQHDKNFYNEYKVDKNIVLPEYLEFLFTTKFYKKLMGMYLTYENEESKVYNKIVIVVPSKFKQNRIISLHNFVKKLMNTYDNFLFTLHHNWRDSAYNFSSDFEQRVNNLDGFIDKCDEEPPELIRILEKEENYDVEFKATWGMRKNGDELIKDEERIYDNCIKTICGFLNTEGGVLAIGVEDNAKVEYNQITGLKGIKDEVKLVKNYRNSIDKYIINIQNSLNKYFGKDIVASKYIKIEKIQSSIKSGSKIILLIKCEDLFKLTDKKGIKVKDRFYIRQNRMTKELKGNEIKNFIKLKT